MLNPVRAVHNYILNTPVDSTFFKTSVLIPVIGNIIQIWKDWTLRLKIQALNSNQDEKLILNNSSGLLKLNSNSLFNGKWVDIACLIAAVAVYRFNSYVGCLLALASVLSYGFRYFSLVLAEDLCTKMVDS